jgi:hypothetical protein
MDDMTTHGFEILLDKMEKNNTIFDLYFRDIAFCQKDQIRRSLKKTLLCDINWIS